MLQISCVNPNPNRDLCPFNPKSYHLQNIPRSFHISSLKTLGSFVFELYPDISMKNALTMRPLKLVILKTCYRE